MTSTTTSHVDDATRTAVITTTFAHPADAVWTLFADPTRLARWWGPPGMPLTIDRHDLRPGGAVELTVTTDGGTIRGRWDIHEVAAPRALAFTFSSDGIGPTDIAVALDATPEGGTAMVLTVRFTSDDALRHARSIGFVEGVTRSCAQAPEALASA